MKNSVLGCTDNFADCLSFAKQPQIISRQTDLGNTTTEVELSKEIIDAQSDLITETTRTTRWII